MNKKVIVYAVSLIVCAAVCVGTYFAYSQNVFSNELFSKKSVSAVNGKAGGSMSTSGQGAAAEVSYETTTTTTTTTMRPSTTADAENHDASSGGNQSSSSMPYLIKVNRKQNVVTIYKNDGSGNFNEPVKAMVCSVGKNGKTPKGCFKTSDKYTWRMLDGGVYGQYATRITGHILFHSVPYAERSKDSLKYVAYNKLGTAASAGCIRLSVIDAKWIYDNCPKGTTVEIYDSSEEEPLGKPDPVKIDTSDSRRGWDPTDPDPKNPWNN